MGEDERLRLVTAGVCSGYIAGHEATVEGHYGDPDEVAAEMAPMVLAEVASTPPAATREAGPPPQAGAEITRAQATRLCSEVMAAHDRQTFAEFVEHFARAVLARWGGAAVQLPQVGAQPTSDEIESGFRAWWSDRFGSAYFGAIPLVACIEWTHIALARWGGAAVPQPVPVSERLPGPEDCDSEDRCWLCGKVEGDWRLMSVVNPGVPHLKYCFSHWLPHWALPVPAAAAGEGRDDG
jgi:hypothetical protein